MPAKSNKSKAGSANVSMRVWRPVEKVQDEDAAMVVDGAEGMRDSSSPHAARVDCLDMQLEKLELCSESELVAELLTARAEPGTSQAVAGCETMASPHSGRRTEAQRAQHAAQERARRARHAKLQRADELRAWLQAEHDRCDSARRKRKLAHWLAGLDLFGIDLFDGEINSGDIGLSQRIKAVIKLIRHKQGPKRGQLTGVAYYAVSCVIKEKHALQECVQRTMHTKAKFYFDWGMFAVRCPTAEVALKLHAAICSDPMLTETALKINHSLDVSPYAMIAKPELICAQSAFCFETIADGVLPPSIMIVGKTSEFIRFLKERFPQIQSLELMFYGGTVLRSAWVLPVSAQTEETGTLGNYLRELGVEVREDDLEEDSCSEYTSSDCESDSEPSEVHVQ